MKPFIHRLINRRAALTRLAGCTAAAGALIHPETAAQAALPDGWPNRPVKLVVPSAAGAQTDIFARFLADHLGKAFGQPFVVENKPGASGNIGTMAVIQAPADGYTLMFSAASFTVVPAALKTDQPYDLLRDLLPIVQIAVGGQFLAVSPDLAVNSVQDLLDLARKEPGKHAYGSVGIGSTTHLIMAWLLSQRALQMTHVPYKSSAEVLRDLTGGALQVGWVDTTSSLGAIQAGKIRVLALGATVRAPKSPGIPTLKDLGIPWELNGWLGLFTRAGVPMPIVNALNVEVNKLVGGDEGQARLAAMNVAGIPPASPEEFAQTIRRDLLAWRKIAVDNQIKPST